MIKQCQFQGVREGLVQCLPLLFNRGFEKNASVLEMRSKLHPRIQDFVRAIRPSAAGVYVLVNALGAGEYWGSNVNGDLFPEKGLINSPPDWENLLVNPDRAREVGQAWSFGYPTFMGAYPYKHHVNKDPSRAFGRVMLATWNPKMHRVELVVYLDRALCAQFDASDVIQRIDNGEYPDVSMGCKVPYDVCTICEHRSKTPEDYCVHAKQMMNRILPDGRKVAVRNDFPRFFDISFVFIGADKTAKTMAKLAKVGNQVCMGDFCTFSGTVKTSASLGQIFTKTADPVDELPANFGYSKERAVEELGRNLDEYSQRPEPSRTPTPMHRRWQRMEARLNDPDIQPAVDQNRTVIKTASAKLPTRLRGALAGASIGAGAGLVGNLSVKADSQTKKKDIVKDSVAGGLAGAIAKLASDPVRERAFSQWRRQKLGEMYGVDISFDRELLEKQANDPIKKKFRVQGIPVWLEWLKGETREYKDKKGVVKYSRHMEADYGYIPGTLDSDGEDLDVYWGGDKNAKNAFVIRQLKKSGGFDEHKVMLGYSSKGAAKSSYVHHMGGTPERFGGMATVPVSALVALFADNKGSKEKLAEACSCHGVGDDCGGSTEKLAALLFPVSKSASHAKLSEIIKSIPAGPFTKETLPKLEQAERDIPNDILDLMGGMPLGNALSTPTMAGMVLKPREFQRMILISIGERPLADDLDNKGMTFERSKEVDESIPLNESSVDPRLLELLSRSGLVKDRSAAGPALSRRSMASSADTPFKAIGGENISSEPVLKKIAAAYNGYRRSVLKKAASISQFLTTDPQLRSDIFGSSMAEAFACGIDKVASSGAFSPDSLAYLVGAYTDRDIHMTNEVVSSLALTGAVAEAA